LFFNFAVLFDFGYCSLAHEMSFVDGYLAYFKQQLITGQLLALLSFQPLFTQAPLVRCAYSTLFPSAVC
jgi:hypothetical protein